MLIDTSSNELGIAVSSARFKREIRDLGKASEALYALRPVAFRYRESEPQAAIEYGLIAEEVIEAAPDLVVYDEAGEPHAVRYQLLAPMLVNEVQKQQRTIEGQQQVIAALTGRLDTVEQQLAAVSADSGR